MSCHVMSRLYVMVFLCLLVTRLQHKLSFVAWVNASLKVNCIMRFWLKCWLGDRWPWKTGDLAGEGGAATLGPISPVSHEMLHRASDLMDFWVQRYKWSVHWINLARNRQKWWDFVNTLMHILVKQKESKSAKWSSNIFQIIIFINETKKNSVAWIRERTIPTERPPLVGEASANFCG
jgi:hypothetical protein